MNKMQIIIFSIAILFLISSCTQTPAKEVVKYVCPDGSTSNSKEGCGIAEEKIETAGGEVVGKISQKSPITIQEEKEKIIILQHNSKQVIRFGRDYYSILGEVKNDDTVTHTFVKVIATLYNNESQIIGTERSYIELDGQLNPQQTSPFDIAFPKENYLDFDNYKLQVS